MRLRLRRAGSALAGAVGVALAGALLGLAAASAPLFVSSAASDALQQELSGPGQPPLFEVQVSGAPGDDAHRAADAAVRDELRELGLPAASATLVAGDLRMEPYPDPLRGTSDQAVLVAVEDGTGALPEAVDESDGEVGGGVAVTEQDAERLGVAAGDVIEVRFALVEQRVEGSTLIAEEVDSVSTEIAIDRVVGDIMREEVPQEWAAQSLLVQYWISPGVDPTYPPDPGYPALLADYDVALEILARLDRAGSDGGVSGPSRTLTLGIPLGGEAATIEGARLLQEPVDEMHARIADPTTDLAAAVALPPARGFPGTSQPLVRTSLPAALARAEQTADGLAGPVGALALGGQALGLLAVGAAAVIGGRQRIERARLWNARGVSPLLLGLRGAAAPALGAVAGAVAGWAAALALIRGLGPGGHLHALAVTAALESAALAAAAGVALIAVALTAASISTARVAGAPRRIPPVVEVTALALAAIAFWQLEQRGGAVALSPDDSAALDPLALALPLLLLIGLAGLGARLLRAALRATGRWAGPRAPGGYLALRRLRSLTPASTALLALAAIATGTLVLAGSLAESSRQTIDEKAGLLVGADVSARLPRPELTRAGLDLDAVPSDQSLVFRAEEALLDDQVNVDVLAVDTATLGDVAFRPKGLDDESFAALLARLEPSGDGPLPAIVAAAGSAPALGAGEVVHEGHAVPIDIVEAVDSFPGMAADRPLIVVGDHRALESEDPQLRARLAQYIDPLLWIRADGEEEHVVAALEVVGVHDDYVRLAADLREDPALIPVTSTFEFLRGQATGIAVLGLAGLLGAFIVGHRQRALSTALARRMGLRRRPRLVADALELGCLLAVAVALGTACGLLAARVVLGQYDPMPALALPPPLVLPGSVLLGVVALAVVAGAAALATTARATARADLPALLRRG